MWFLINSAIMSVAASLLPLVCFILIQIIFTNAARGHSSSTYNNTIDDASQWKTVRSRRSTHANMPQFLKIRIKFTSGIEMSLHWIKKSQYLANKYLPVITTSGDEIPNVMENVGEFVVYHDVEKCSAVVYYEKLNAFFGNIGMDYSITNLPYKLDAHGNYDGVAAAPFIMRRDNILFHNRLSLPNTNIAPQFSDRSADWVRKRPSDSDPGPSNKYQRIKRDFVFDQENFGEKVVTDGSQIKHVRTRRWNPLNQEYYLEILIFITRDVAEMFKKGYGAYYTDGIVRYCINHFNAADMIFKKLGTKDLKLLINIAKIVIEDDSVPFDFMRYDVIQSADAVAKLRQYLHAFRHIFTPDSFDHVFMITSLPIKDASNFVTGKTEHAANMYEARQNDQFYAAVPITILSYVTDYVVAVQEIGLTLNIKIDSGIDNRHDGIQCWSIMQQESSKCDNCLRWSLESRRQFSQFFSNNRNRCFLLNDPRSVKPIGPSIYLTPHRQCQCFGYSFHLRNFRGDTRSAVRHFECKVPLQCKTSTAGQCSHEDTLLPFDGTPCGNHKVCWAGECVSVVRQIPCNN